MTAPNLHAIVDGTPLPNEEAHDLWARFSLYMDENQGDFAGFATKEGFVSAQVAVEEGLPTLRLDSVEPAPQPMSVPAAKTIEAAPAKAADEAPAKPQKGSKRPRGGKRARAKRNAINRAAAAKKAGSKPKRR